MTHREEFWGEMAEDYCSSVCAASTGSWEGLFEKEEALYTLSLPVGRPCAFRQLFPPTFCQNFATVCDGTEVGITDVFICGETAESVTRVWRSFRKSQSQSSYCIRAMRAKTPAPILQIACLEIN